MTALKNTLLAVLIVAGPLAASPAFAWQYFNGTAWVNNGSVTISGPTVGTVAGIIIPCSNTTFTLALNGGTASIVAANFSGGSACTNNVTASNLSWSMSSGTPTGSGSADVVITGITLTFRTPPATCSNGTLRGKFTNLGNSAVNSVFTYTITFPPPTLCSNFKSTGAMAVSAPLRNY
ncbi:hypothetical protein [Luteimonas aquatica]|uniref:hypothetical protein n=1 Tax=Luteimonas aquatica TaxID=450364 RepID=UPI001F57454C|nr:hypothetical protein [Luteimonas aquatica]